MKEKEFIGTFVQPAFIRKNTPELRKKLEELGYIDIHDYHPDVIKKCKYLQTYTGYYMYEHSTDDVFLGSIDCGENEDMFLELVALRSDRDCLCVDEVLSKYKVI